MIIIIIIIIKLYSLSKTGECLTAVKSPPKYKKNSS